MEEEEEQVELSSFGDNNDNNNIIKGNLIVRGQGGIEGKRRRRRKRRTRIYCFHTYPFLSFTCTFSFPSCSSSTSPRYYSLSSFSISTSISTTSSYFLSFFFSLPNLNKNIIIFPQAMKMSPRRLSKPRGAILLALGVVVLSITARTVLARSTADHQLQQRQHPEAQAQAQGHQQEPQRKQQQQHHEQQSSDHADNNDELGLDDQGAFYAAFDTVPANGGEQLHKMIGVDYKPEGASRSDYNPGQQQQTDFEGRDGEDAGENEGGNVRLNVGESNERDEAIDRENVGNASRCLLFSDEFDKLDNSVWRVSP